MLEPARAAGATHHLVAAAAEQARVFLLDRRRLVLLGRRVVEPRLVRRELVLLDLRVDDLVLVVVAADGRNNPGRERGRQQCFCPHVQPRRPCRPCAWKCDGYSRAGGKCNPNAESDALIPHSEFRTPRYFPAFAAASLCSPAR